MRSNPTLRMRIYHAQEFKCYYCGKKTPYYVFTLDHKIPRSRGGKFLHNNKVGACQSCNKAKADLTEEEFKSCKDRNEAKRKHAEIQRAKLQAKALQELSLSGLSPCRSLETALKSNSKEEGLV